MDFSLSLSLSLLGRNSYLNGSTSRLLDRRGPSAKFTQLRSWPSFSTRLESRHMKKFELNWLPLPLAPVALHICDMCPKWPRRQHPFMTTASLLGFNIPSALRRSSLAFLLESPLLLFDLPLPMVSPQRLLPLLPPCGCPYRSTQGNLSPSSSSSSH